MINVLRFFMGKLCIYFVQNIYVKYRYKMLCGTTKIQIKNLCKANFPVLNSCSMSLLFYQFFLYF